MNDVLDLSVELKLPPEGSPPETIAAIALRCEQLGLWHEGDLLVDPLQPKERENLAWYLEEYWQWPYDAFAETAGRIEGEVLPNVGKRLYTAVFGGAASIVEPWRLQPGVRRQISIQSYLPRALSLPWELLHDEQGFLTLKAQPVSILRRLPQAQAASLLAPFTPPLCVLLVTARPEEEGFVDPRIIARELVDEMKKQIDRGAVVLEFLRPPTLPALRERLRDAERPVHVLHFDGHGAFGEQPNGGGAEGEGLSMRVGAQGVLAFEDEEGRLDRVRAGDLANVLQGAGVRLVMLTACQSALGSADDVFSSVAGRLIRGGVDAVGAMSASVLVASASRYAEAFYRALAARKPAPVAQEYARQALHDDPRRHLFQRHLDQEAEYVRLRDWWLPHFFQQRPLTFNTTEDPTPIERKPPRFNELFPPSPRYGFVGRSYSLLRIERWLLQRKLIVIHGFGGMGKTALAREAADWLSRTGMYGGACFVSYEGGGDAVKLLSELGRYTEVDSAEYNPSDYEAALDKLRPALSEQPTMVITDNLESILPRGEAALETPEQAKLWDVILKLASMPGCGMLATTRDTNFGDARMALGSRVSHLPLEGLHPEDAYTLAINLIKDLGIDRARAPYAELRDLLEKLGHYPLSIQLVLPTLSDTSLEKINEDFAALLPRFNDDTETGRNSSLVASLEYSLRRLSDEQRALLVRLAPFEGGASEDNLLTIAEISEEEWTTLRPALERSALLRAETLFGLTRPYLSFHPVLTPYLREKGGVEDPVLQKRYAEHYHAVAHYLYKEDLRNPQAVRLLARRELPNLRRTLKLLLEGGKLEDASLMVDSVNQFLGSFGLWRERDVINAKLAEAVVTEEAGEGEALTLTQYMIERQRITSALEKGDANAAYEISRTLLKRIEAQPEGAPLSFGRGSSAHSDTLLLICRALRMVGQPAAAEDHLRKALKIVEALIVQEPTNEHRIRKRIVMLTVLGDVLTDQGKYRHAREAYVESLKLKRQLGDLRGEAVTLGQLGTLELEQRNSPMAREHYTTTLKIFQELGEPQGEAISWHQLGRVAEQLENWDEAERYYRKSLAIKEQHGNWVGATTTRNQLGRVAWKTGRHDEARVWFMRIINPPNVPRTLKSKALYNFSGMLLAETQQERSPQTRDTLLVEAQQYAEQSLEDSLEPWAVLNLLAQIADERGQEAVAMDYRRREREAYAVFERNRRADESGGRGGPFPA